jgi:hypothetical protein
MLFYHLCLWEDTNPLSGVCLQIFSLSLGFVFSFLSRVDVLSFNEVKFLMFSFIYCHFAISKRSVSNPKSLGSLCYLLRELECHVLHLTLQSTLIVSA